MVCFVWMRSSGVDSLTLRPREKMDTYFYGYISTKNVHLREEHFFPVGVNPWLQSSRIGNYVPYLAI